MYFSKVSKTKEVFNTTRRVFVQPTPIDATFFTFLAQSLNLIFQDVQWLEELSFKLGNLVFALLPLNSQDSIWKVTKVDL